MSDVLEIFFEVEAPAGAAELMLEVARRCCEAEGVTGVQACVQVIDGAAIHEVNRAQRGVDRETDVLSFPTVRYPAGRTAKDVPRRLRREYDPGTGRCFLGDILISLPRAMEQAEAYGHSPQRELGFLTAHAMFHLFGYDHEAESDRRAMRAMEEKALRACGLSRDAEDAGPDRAPASPSDGPANAPVQASPLLRVGDAARGADAMTDEALFARACEALKNAYAPYSNYRVGACLLASDGRAFAGCNIENASYPAGLCAERAAVAAAVSAGAREFAAIAVAGEHGDAWPCGICRQVLSEFAPDLRVICGRADTGAFTVERLSALLPHAFGPKSLKDAGA